MVSKGVDDLARGVSSREALLVSIGASRLRENGVPIPKSVPAEAELQLYRLLRSERPRDAYSFYNSLLRRLISFEKALEHLNHR